MTSQSTLHKATVRAEAYTVFLMFSDLACLRTPFYSLYFNHLSLSSVPGIRYYSGFQGVLWWDVQGLCVQTTNWTDIQSRNESIDLLKVGVKAKRHSTEWEQARTNMWLKNQGSFLGSFNELSLEELISWGGNGVYPYADWHMGCYITLICVCESHKFRTFAHIYTKLCMHGMANGDFFSPNTWLQGRTHS